MNLRDLLGIQIKNLWVNKPLRFSIGCATYPYKCHHCIIQCVVNKERVTFKSSAARNKDVGLWVLIRLHCIGTSTIVTLHVPCYRPLSYAPNIIDEKHWNQALFRTARSTNAISATS